MTSLAFNNWAQYPKCAQEGSNMQAENDLNLRLAHVRYLTKYTGLILEGILCYKAHNFSRKPPLLESMGLLIM